MSSFQAFIYISPRWTWDRWMLRQMSSFRCHLSYPCPSNPLRIITSSDWVV